MTKPKMLPDAVQGVIFHVRSFIGRGDFTEDGEKDMIDSLIVLDNARTDFAEMRYELEQRRRWMILEIGTDNMKRASDRLVEWRRASGLFSASEAPRTP